MADEPDPALVARLRRTMDTAAADFDLDEHARLIARRVEQVRHGHGDCWATDELVLALLPALRRHR